MVAVPRREVYSELDALTAARLRDFTYDVALSVLVGRVLHRMLGIGAGPKAETVVVLGREDKPLEPCILDDLHQSVGIEVRGVEYRLGLVAIAPLAVGECIDGKVYECILLHTVPLQLPRRRHYAHRRRRLGRTAPEHHGGSEGR